MNVELDHAKSVSMSPDSRFLCSSCYSVWICSKVLFDRAVVTATDDGNQVRVFKISRKKDGTGTCSDVVDFLKVCTYFKQMCNSKRLVPCMPEVERGSEV